MALQLWAVPAAGSSAMSLDDTSVDTDLGVQFVARIISGKFSSDGNDYAHFRHFLQQFFVGGLASGIVVPIVNSSPSLPSQQSFSYNVAVDGTSIQLECPFFGAGVDFQVQVEVDSHVGAVYFGGAEMWVVPRRQHPL